MNNTISKNELIVYLREVFRLEHKKRSLENACENLITEIESIKQINYDYEPKVDYVEPPTAPSEKLEPQEHIRKGIIAGMITLFIFIFGGSYAIAPFIPDDAPLEPYAYKLLAVALTVSIMTVVLVPFIVAKIVNTKEKKIYAMLLDNYNIAIENAQNKYNDEMKKWKERCERVDNQNERLNCTRSYKRSLLSEMRSGIKEIELALEKLYGYNVISSQYRSCNAIANILNYFESGRVDTLKEALNKYDEDVFRGQVLTSLDDISFSQERTYSAIRDNNLLIQNAVSNIDSISSQNNAMLNYQQVAAENSKAILSSVKNVEFLQTIDMMDRLIGR